MSDLQGLLDFLPSLYGRSKVGNYILLLIVCVLLSFAVLHWWTMPPHQSLHISLGSGGGFLLGIYIFIRVEEGASRRFLTWLRDKQSEIEADEAYYRGEIISSDTERVWFMACVSCAVVSVRFVSRPLRPKSGIASCYRAGMTLLSLATGWWGIPWGPVYTVQALGWSLGGGRVEKVHVLLWEIEQEARIAAIGG